MALQTSGGGGPSYAPVSPTSPFTPPSSGSFAPITQHATNPATGPSSSIGKTVSRTLATQPQPTRSLQMLSQAQAPTYSVPFVGSTQHVNPGFLTKVDAAAKSLGATQVIIKSGYRDPAHNAAVGGVAHSNHLTGHALDGWLVINGKHVPLGTALASIASKYGLRSGTSFLYQGSPDYMHVDDAANQPGGVLTPTTSLVSTKTGTKTSTPSVKLASDVPKPLATAIYTASQKYGVPPDLLAGIWRVESGSTYPNPAKNSSGYGGLFGTTNAFGPTQAQANLAASVLAAGLKASGGNVGQALSYYNSGKLVGGYTSVPGQTTFGNYSASGGSDGGAAGASTGDGSVAVTTGGAGSGLPQNVSTFTLGAGTGGSSYSGQPFELGGAGKITVNTAPTTFDPKNFPSIVDPNLPNLTKAWQSDINALQNPNAFLKSAGAQAYAQLAPAIAQLIASGKAGANTITQFNRGQQQLLNQLPSQIADIYNPGIAIEQQTAQSLGASLAAATPNAADQAALQAIGAPPEQQQQVATQNQLSFGLGGQTLTNLGNMPAFTLTGQKLAAQANAASLSKLSGIQAGQQLSAYQQTQAAAMSKLLQTEPALAAKIASTLIGSTSAAAKQLGTSIAQSKATSQKIADRNVNIWKAQNTSIIDNGKLKISTGQLNIAQQNADNNAIGQAGRLGVSQGNLSIAQQRANNDAIYKAGQLADASNRALLYGRRTKIMITNHADDLAKAATAEADKIAGQQGFRFVRDAAGNVIWKDGAPLLQFNKGVRGKYLPDSGTVVTWNVPTGGKTGAGKGYVVGWGATKPSSVSIIKSRVYKAVDTYATPANPKRVQGGPWQFPAGYSQNDLVRPDLAPLATYTDESGQQQTNTLKVKTWNEAFQYAMSLMPVDTPQTEKAVFDHLIVNKNYNQGGVNGAPYTQYSDYVGNALNFIDNNRDKTPTQIGALMAASGLFPNSRYLVKAVTAAEKQIKATSGKKNIFSGNYQPFSP